MRKMHRRYVVLSLPVLLAAPLVALAHGPEKGPRGGVMADAGDYHLELIVGDGVLSLGVTDGEGKPVDTEGATGSAFVLANKKNTKLELAPGGGNLLRGKGDFKKAKGMKVVVLVTLPGRKPVRARFTPGAAE